MDNLKHINSLTEQAYNLTAKKYHDLFHNEMDEKEYDKKVITNLLKTLISLGYRIEKGK